MKVKLSVNDKNTVVEIPASRKLSDVLRTQGFWSVKHGCETGDCGNCTVLVDGKAVNSCMMLAVQAEGKHIETFDFSEEEDKFKPLKNVLLDFADIECAFCVPGMFLSLKALVDKIPDPTEEEVVDALSGHVCRCVKYSLPIEPIIEAAKKIRGEY